MPDGDIIEYIGENPGANRLLLVRTHQLEDQWGYPDYTHNSWHKHVSV